MKLEPAARTGRLGNPLLETSQTVLTRPGDRTLQLAFSNHTPGTVEEGLRRLSAAVAELGARVPAALP